MTADYLASKQFLFSFIITPAYIPQSFTIWILTGSPGDSIWGKCSDMAVFGYGSQLSSQESVVWWVGDGSYCLTYGAYSCNWLLPFSWTYVIGTTLIMEYQWVTWSCYKLYWIIHRLFLLTRWQKASSQCKHISHNNTLRSPSYAFLTLHNDTVFTHNNDTYSLQNPWWEVNWLDQYVDWEKSLKWCRLISGILPQFVLIYFSSSTYSSTHVFDDSPSRT